MNPIDGPAGDPGRAVRWPALAVLWEDPPGSGRYLDRATGQTYRADEAQGLAGYVLLFADARQPAGDPLPRGKRSEGD